MMNQDSEDLVFRFEDVKDRIKEELSKRGKEIGIHEPVILFEGFFKQPYSNELSYTFTLGGPSIPIIMLIGNHTGRIYFFALKSILTDLDW